MKNPWLQPAAIAWQDNAMEVTNGNSVKIHLRAGDLQAKLQGLAYYADCYKYWDLNLCEKAFAGQKYDKLINGNIDLISDLGIISNSSWILSCVDFEKHEHKFENYYSSLSKNIKRDIKIAKKNELYFKQYDFNIHIDDFIKTNTLFNSWSTRKRRKSLNRWYMSGHHKFHRSHSGMYLHKWENELHYSKWLGVFKYMKNYAQNNRFYRGPTDPKTRILVQTDEKLLAYCKIAVDGEAAFVTLILGNPEYYNKGIMALLITGVVEEIMKNCPSVKYVVYGSGQPSPESKWKKRYLFNPVILSDLSL